MITLPVTQARKQLLTLVDRIDDEYTRVDLTKKGKVKASLVAPDYLDALEETIYSLTYSMKDIKAAQKEIREGKYVTLDEFRRNRRERYARKGVSSSKRTGKKDR